MGRSMTRWITMVLLVTILTYKNTSGARCRFARSSASQGSCIFPCRCTNGCHTTTGQCINGGVCEDDQPSGHDFKWTGAACQEGNVAYAKSASQSIGDWGGSYPAGRAVDGDTNPHMGAGHCAHPDTDWGKNAWWMVDLKDTYNISRVIIYNKDSAHNRLDTFILSVGNTRERRTHKQCASHNGRVPAGGTVESQCRAIARYVSFRRNGSPDSYAAGLCEVVIIGHRHITCSNCPTTSTCDDIVGCDQCDQGKQQPDCTEDCEPGTYGKNCEEDCGHCKDGRPCDITDGHCTTGCETWYTSAICKSYISTPRLASSDKPDVDRISSSSVTVRWPSARNITSGEETHYFYTVWIKAEGGSYKDMSRQPHTSSTGRFEAHITGLQFNTHYSVKVEPYRQQNELSEAGTSTGVTTFKTLCIAPDIPTVETVTVSTQAGSNKGYIDVIWKELKSSGCDNIVAVVIYYKRQSSATWKKVPINKVTDTKVTLQSVSYDEYDVKLTATNNENITSTSSIVNPNFLPSKSVLYTCYCVP
ncbi:hypothetical protein NP493_265g00032 [Ridgeia piscesae]|uniref:Fibronectin type-III domain-containing protein n=1 Tax=Ridgeia piscesae TaxID=27915 RepID=A0AAD9UCP4_RIDPI|nr:hypothetical protein NP493_265g00032 [Ridgeia piscesae]